MRVIVEDPLDNNEQEEVEEYEEEDSDEYYEDDEEVRTSISANSLTTMNVL